MAPQDPPWIRHCREFRSIERTFHIYAANVSSAQCYETLVTSMIVKTTINFLQCDQA